MYEKVPSHLQSTDNSWYNEFQETKKKVCYIESLLHRYL